MGRVAKALNWSNGTDAVMGGVAFIPGVGWVVSGAYFITNSIIIGTTGKSIGEHLGDFYNEHPQIGSALSIGMYSSLFIQ